MLKLFNALTNSINEIKNNENVRIYCCGPTIYDDIHIGNARPIILVDLLNRYFKLKKIRTDYLLNITDIDDKIIDKAIKENVGEKEISQKYYNNFFNVLEQLNILKPNKIMKISEHINEMIDFISELEKSGDAYCADGNVYFNTSNYLNEYYKLSKQKLENIELGSRIEIDENKKNPIDFVIWKKTQKGIAFDSKWSNGRPGWHTECSVLNDLYFKNTIDIHVGGIDLKFPHHENERIQFIAKNKKEQSRFWIYNGHISVNLKKMSKSLNNSIYVKDFLKIYDVNLLKYIFYNTNYKNPINFTEIIIDESKKWNDKNFLLLKTINWKFAICDLKIIDNDCIDYENEIIQCIESDLNTPGVITIFDEMYKTISKQIRKNEINKNLFELYTNLLKIFGFSYIIKKLGDIDIKNINEWNQAVKNNDYFKSDKLRNKLIEDGIF